MENITKITESNAIPVTGASSAAPVPVDTAAFDELATLMAQQGLFGKIRMGASLLLFGEVNVPNRNQHDA